MNAVAIVPAYNEERTLGGVLKALLDAGIFTRILVVSDGSTDRTASIAREAGVEVIELSPNRGKGGAMLEAFRRTTEPVVAFFDADLLRLTPEHIRKIAGPVLRGDAGMIVGLQDYGRLGNMIQAAMPPISGQRAVTREILEQVPAEHWSGYRIEAGINEAACRSGLDIGYVISHGIGHYVKWQKTDPKKGIEDMTKMARDVLVAMAEAKQVRPAGEATLAAKNEIRVLADGRIEGADGLMSQIAGHVARQVKTEILPELQRDKELQERVGLAIGKGAAEETAFWLKVLAVAGIVIAGTYAYSTFLGGPSRRERVRTNPSRRQRRRRHA